VTEGTRTLHLFLGKEALYQMSYGHMLIYFGADGARMLVAAAT
jgi:hypothetical protein